MGKPLIHQRRGKGSPTFRSPEHRYKSVRLLNEGVIPKYKKYSDKEGENKLKGIVLDIVDDPGRNAPQMLVEFEDGVKCLLPAPEGIRVGDVIEQGEKAALKIGCITFLKNIPEGYPVYNIEVVPGDGGKLVRSTGMVAYIVSKDNGKVKVKLPSGYEKYFDEKCRATIGVVCGGGRLEKPLLKAGKAYHKHKARNKYYPIVRGVAMNAYDHPHGGKEHHPGGSTCVSKNAPPGRKAGHIGARRTGRRNK